MSAKDLSGYAFEYRHQFFKQSLIIHADCLEWMEHLLEERLHAIVTDPPYGVKEYDFDQLEKRLMCAVSIYTRSNCPLARR